MVGKKDSLKKAIGVKIAIFIIIALIFLPIIPVETQIQCITTPCDPVVENKSIIQILMKN